MINERVGIEDAFAMVVEAVLSNTHCGSTLIRKPKGLSSKSLKICYDELQEITQESVPLELMFLENCPKVDTFICFTPIGFQLSRRGSRNEIEYIKTALKVLKEKGRLIITVPGNFMTAPYAEETRRYHCLY